MVLRQACRELIVLEMMDVCMIHLQNTGMQSSPTAGLAMPVFEIATTMASMRADHRNGGICLESVSSIHAPPQPPVC